MTAPASPHAAWCALVAWTRRRKHFVAALAQQRLRLFLYPTRCPWHALRCVATVLLGHGPWIDPMNQCELSLDLSLGSGLCQSLGQRHAGKQFHDLLQRRRILSVECVYYAARVLCDDKPAGALRAETETTKPAHSEVDGLRQLFHHQAPGA